MSRSIVDRSCNPLAIGTLEKKAAIIKAPPRTVVSAFHIEAKQGNHQRPDFSRFSIVGMLFISSPLEPCDVQGRVSSAEAFCKGSKGLLGLPSDSSFLSDSSLACWSIFVDLSYNICIHGSGLCCLLDHQRFETMFWQDQNPLQWPIQ